MVNYINLHSHTHYSFLHSLMSPKDLLKGTKDLNQTAVAITDYSSFAGIWEAFKFSKEIDIKLIVGAEFYFTDDIQDKQNKPSHLILLAKNHQGYSNLLQLHREGFEHPFVVYKRVCSLIDWNLLKKYSDGVICLTGSAHGILGKSINQKNFDKATEDLKHLVEIFGNNLGIEVQATNLTRNNTYYIDQTNQIFTNYQLINLGKKYNVKIVPTSNAHYLKKEDAETHDVMMAIGSMQPVYSNGRAKYNMQDFYLRTGDEIVNFFSRNYGKEFAESICANTIYFANQCENPDWVDPKYSNPSGKELPVFPVKDTKDYTEFKLWRITQPENIKKLDEDKLYLRFKCEKSFNQKVTKDKYKEYLDRLNEELDVLEYHGFSSYMLIVGDFVAWAKENEIRVGTGRGSCGGSFVAYLLGIHQADPIKYGLIFARFLNKDKVSIPDIDMDFAPSGRDKVQNYIREKYGPGYVAQVSNLMGITPKVYARDLARACEFGNNRQKAVQIGTNIADAIPKRVENVEIKTLEQVKKVSPLYCEYIKRYSQLEKNAIICGKYRTWSTHAAGLVIGKRPLSTIIPVRKDKDGILAIEMDKDKAEQNGLVKMDLLGLETLDIIQETYNIIKNNNKELPPDPPDFDEYDKKTYDLISSGNTFCVFQLGQSAGTIDLCKKIKPQNIEDISHINALARPAVADARPRFIKARSGKAVFKLPHPSLERALGGTYGEGVYEECLMYIAKDVAGWDYNKADSFRKLTKDKGKNKDKIPQLKKEFIDDAVKCGILEKTAEYIWSEIIVKFGGYGFNKSHSILYSLISYHTAYLKAHFPIEFLLANLFYETKSNAKDADVKREKIKNEIRKYNVKIIPPDINNSDMSYKLIDQNTLLSGLEAIKTLGEDAIKDIIDKRPFRDFDDFMLRTNTAKVRSTSIQALAATGAFHQFGLNKRAIFHYCSDYRKKLTTWLKKHDPSKEKFVYDWPKNEREWTDKELFALERHFLGESLSCNKKNGFAPLFDDNRHLVFSDIKKLSPKTRVEVVKGEIRDFHLFTVKKNNSKFYGQEMSKVLLEDENGESIIVTIFPDRLKDIKQILKNKLKLNNFDIGYCLHFSASVNIYDGELTLILDNIYDIILPPSLPKDIKDKKEIKVKKIKEVKTEKTNNLSLLDNIENELIEGGFITNFEDPT